MFVMQLWKMPVYGIVIAYGRARQVGRWLVCTKAKRVDGEEERLSSDGLRKKQRKRNKEEGERASERAGESQSKAAQLVR
jgi:hypothetical protein